MAETYSAGIVTAYGAAVRGGYTGTYEEFCAEQASFAENAEQVAQDREDMETLAAQFSGTTVPAAVQMVQNAGAAQIQAMESASETEQQQIALAGAAQETRVTQAGDDQVDAVDEAGATQVGNVNAAGTTQVGNVNTAGTTQVNAVQAKGQEVIDSIPEDFTDLQNEVGDLKSALDEYADIFTGDVDESVQNWLDAHPEATTTVQDGSLTLQKFKSGELPFVTPEQFGAKGDGVTDDTAALNEAFEYPSIVLKPNAIYKVDYIDVSVPNTTVDGCGATILFNSNRGGQSVGSTDNIYKTECISNRRTRNSGTFNKFVIRNTIFNGGGASFSNYTDYDSTYTELMVLQLFNYDTVFVDSCTFDDTIQDAVYIYACKNISVKNSVFNKIAFNTRIPGSRNAITAIANANDGLPGAEIVGNVFSDVYDECMRIDDFATVVVADNNVSHCYQYFAELFFSNVAVYDSNYCFSNNNVREIADSFILVGSAIQASLKLVAENNTITGLGSSNFLDNDHTIYQCAFVKNGYNSNCTIIARDNYIVVDNANEKTQPVVEALYSNVFLENNNIVINNNFASSGFIITANSLLASNNKIKPATGKTPSFTAWIAGIKDKIQLLNNIIQASIQRGIQFGSGVTTSVRIEGNELSGVPSSGVLVYTGASFTVFDMYVRSNTIKTGKFVTYMGTVDNIIYSENIVPTGFMLSPSTTYTNKIEVNNLETIT